MELTISASPFELAGLRRAARDALSEVPTQVADELLLALDEAATNAILHGSGGGDPIQVAVRVRDAWVEATVLDHGPTTPPRPLSTTDRLSGGGWGLWLCCCLVDEVHLERVEGGTRVTLRRRIRPQRTVTGVGGIPRQLRWSAEGGSADRRNSAAKVLWPTKESPVARDPEQIAATLRQLARLDLVELGHQALPTSLGHGWRHRPSQPLPSRTAPTVLTSSTPASSRPSANCTRPWAATPDDLASLPADMERSSVAVGKLVGAGTTQRVAAGQTSSFGDD